MSGMLASLTDCKKNNNNNNATDTFKRELAQRINDGAIIADKVLP